MVPKHLLDRLREVADNIADDSRQRNDPEGLYVSSIISLALYGAVNGDVEYLAIFSRAGIIIGDPDGIEVAMVRLELGHGIPGSIRA